MTRNVTDVRSVTIRLVGGLGNQMFQYAAGLALATRLKSNINLDLSWFDVDFTRLDLTPRSFELDELMVDATQCRLRHSNSSLARLASRAVRRSIDESSYPPAAFHEVSIGRRPLHLHGYWQDPRYFEPVQDELRRQFQLRNRADEEKRSVFRAIAAEIAEGPTIGVNVRRGDYVSHARTAAFHGAQPVE